MNGSMSLRNTLRPLGLLPRVYLHSAAQRRGHRIGDGDGGGGGDGQQARQERDKPLSRPFALDD